VADTVPPGGAAELYAVEPRGPTGGHRHLGVVVLAVMVFESMLFHVLSPLLPEYSEQFGLSKTGAGALAAASPLGMLLTTLAIPRIARKLGVRSIAVAGLLLMAGSTVAFGLAGTTSLLIAFRVAQGIAGALAWVGAMATWLDSVPLHRRSRAAGDAIAATFLGSMTGPILGAAVLWAGAVVTFAAAAAVACSLAFLVSSAAEAEDHRLEDLPSSRGPTWVRNAVIGAAFAAALAFGARFILPPLALADRGLGGSLIALVFTVGAAGSAIGSSIAGRAMDRHGPRPLLVAGTAAASGTIVFLALATSVPTLAIGTIAVGIALQLQFGAAFTALREELTLKQPTSVEAVVVINSIWTSGALAGSLSAGWFASRTSDEVTWLLLAALVALTGAIAWRALRARSLPNAGSPRVAC
jgi:MFS transporter, DHA1 family, solute carrier family 18 (vesicular amine transporter), member 1/2